jgi:hypothetical protein
MQNGNLHALQHNEQNIDLMFAPYGPDGTGTTMRPRRFDSRVALGDFLKDKIAVHEDARQNFLRHLVSMRHATMDEVWLSEEQRLQLGL